ncbi:lysophospholipid acyltransferase family protein [Intestinibacillus massiliensis]|uniref:lysophospholipid acyltransferase family protein n=1 Tax=Intestinibacillus massiliensis TaxID=1871029 RepID=UPI000B35BC53|nr:lysophospholipid acyltransferase family protein [Intestinibacillus massiliensis]
MPKTMPKFHRWLQKIAVPIVSAVYHLYYRLHVTGHENIPEGGCVVCPNHTSYADPPLAAVSLTWRTNIALMAKKELFEKGGFFAHLIGWLGAFPVSRGDADITAIKTALQAVKDGRKLIIFPQGTRDAAEGETKEGAAMLAARTRAPILPVYITENKKRFGRVDVIIGKPFYPEKGSKDYAAIAEDILRRIYALNGETRA